MGNCSRYHISEGDIDNRMIKGLLTWCLKLCRLLQLSKSPTGLHKQMEDVSEEWDGNI